MVGNGGKFTKRGLWSSVELRTTDISYTQGEENNKIDSTNNGLIMPSAQY